MFVETSDMLISMFVIQKNPTHTKSMQGFEQFHLT